MGRGLNIVSQIIYLAKKIRKLEQHHKQRTAKRLFKILIRLEKQEIAMIREESGSKEFYERTLYIFKKSKKIYSDLQNLSLKQLDELLDEIIALENQELKEVVKKESELTPSIIKTVDPYIRRIVNEINKLSFVDKTTHSCSGHFPYDLKAYIGILYNFNSKTAKSISSFHKQLAKITGFFRNPQHNNIFYYYLNDHHITQEQVSPVQAVPKLRDKIEKKWKLISRLVIKYKDRDSLNYKKEKICLNKKLLDDEAERLVYCSKCGKYIYTNHKECPSCGADIRILKRL